MGKKNKKPGPRAGQPFRPLAGSTPAAITPIRDNPVRGSGKGRLIRVFYPSGTTRDMRGHFISDEKGPRITLTESANVAAGAVHAVVPGGQQSAVLTSALADLKTGAANGDKVALTAGYTVGIDPGAVVIDAEIQPTYKCVLHAPMPGANTKYPLWPADAAAFKQMPEQLQFVTNFPISRYMIISPKGERRVVSGRFGFQAVAPFQNVGDAGNMEVFGFPKGKVPGRPAIRTVDTSAMKNPKDANGNPATIIELAIPFSSAVIDLNSDEIVYFPFCAKPGDEWPRSVIVAADNPGNLTFGGTGYRLADYPDGPPVPGFDTAAGFAGYGFKAENTEGVLSPYDEMTFAGAEEMRSRLVTMYRKNPDAALHYSSMRDREGWYNVAKLLASYRREGEKADEQYIAAIFEMVPKSLARADIVMWEAALAEEALGPLVGDGFRDRENMVPWYQKTMPVRLLAELDKPQLHVFRTPPQVITRQSERDTWDLENPCMLAGFLLIPYGVQDMEYPNAEERRGLIPVYFFVPVPWNEADKLTEAECYFRARALHPILCDKPGSTIFHGYAQIAAMLDFMTSPRVISVPPADYQPPVPSGRTSTSTPAPRDPNAPVHVYLRRVEILPEALAGLEIPEAGDRKDLTEGFYRKKHTKTVRFGPGRLLTREVTIARTQVRKDLPLKPEAERQVQARENADPVKHITVAL